MGNEHPISLFSSFKHVRTTLTLLLLSLTITGEIDFEVTD